MAAGIHLDLCAWPQLSLCLYKARLPLQTPRNHRHPLQQRLEAVSLQLVCSLPQMDVPLRTLIPVTLCGGIYLFAQGFVIEEGLINLRALPPSAYESAAGRQYSNRL